MRVVCDLDASTSHAPVASRRFTESAAQVADVKARIEEQQGAAFPKAGLTLVFQGKVRLPPARHQPAVQSDYQVPSSVATSITRPHS